MSFQVLDARDTDLGELVLRRRFSRAFGADVYEVTLDGAFLMSSAVHDTEVALAREALGPFTRPVRVLAGGLGLGHTARALLDDARVEHLVVAEYLAPVIAWHETGVVPLGPGLTRDPRCEIVQADFFDLVATATEVFDAIVVDIDHSPAALLSTRHAAFYRGSGPARVAARLAAGGVFALWSADPPDEDFLAGLRVVFPSVRAREIRFEIPQLDASDANTVVVASNGRAC